MRITYFKSAISNNLFIIVIVITYVFYDIVKIFFR